MTRLRPFFSYYGGKWRDAARYPTPEHGTIVEPFAGSAGYAVTYANRDVVLCDTDPIVCAVWRYLIAATPREILSIPDVPLDGTVHDLAVPQEARWLVGFWLNRACEMPRVTPSPWMRSGIRPGSFWGERVRRTLAAQVPAIRHWKVYERSYEACPVARPATWFIDPPYQVAGARYRKSSRQLDYAELGAWCRSRLGQVIVCEHAGAPWLPFKAMAATKATRRNRRSAEAAWVRP